MKKLDKIKKSKIRVKFSDNSEWEIPVEVIARDRATHYCSVDQCPFNNSLQETWELFADDNFEIIDWACNNMNWRHVEKSARLVESEYQVDFESEWCDAHKEIVE